uniref:GB1/RHD3-type G domain-containing protein n=1 Tax=Panagrolaimus sp. ES5 TaxID=591445 RepID=A0AC34FIR3_9BILA
MSINDCAVQIIEHLSNTQFRAKKEELQKIYGDKRVSDLPLVVLCIAGAARKGKSFMLNFFLDYLIHKEKYPTKPWQINDATSLAGFEFRDGEDRTTLGIWAWNHVFIIEQGDGTKVGVSLDLVFIIRDFCFKKYLDDENGGQMYIDKVLCDVKVEQLQQLRDGLNASYERKFGFVFPHPGEKVALEKTSNIVDMNPKFVYRAKEMVEALLSPSELQIKRVGPSVMYCKNMCDYISLCVKCFDDNQHFAPKAVQAVNRDFMFNLEVSRACEAYDILMEKAFVNCDSGYAKDKFAALHNKVFQQIQNDIVKRIKDEGVVKEVTVKSVDQLLNIFTKYKEKNDLLVEQEKKRLQIIEEKRRH